MSMSYYDMETRSRLEHLAAFEDCGLFETVWKNVRGMKPLKRKERKT